jgi:hypothetical protein
VAKRRENSRRGGPYRHRRYGLKQVQELVQIAAVLEGHPELEELVAQDLERALPNRAKDRMRARQVLRAFIIKDINGHDWTMLEWQLINSESYRRFCGTEEMFPKYLSRTTLQVHIDAVTSTTVARFYEILSDARAEHRR